MKLYRFTYLLLALGFFVGLFSPTFLRKVRLQNASSVNQRDDFAKAAREKQREAELRSQYPTVDFDEAETAEGTRRSVQKVRKQRHNNAAIVSRNPSPKDKEVASLPEGLFDLSALPIAQSDFVAMADVSQAEAHMAEDRGNVYTEFELRLWEVFKSGEMSFNPGQTITAERQGGYVRYPNNQKILYRVMKSGMPKVGSRYVLFLKLIPQSDVYTILTGYEIGPTGISPLDLSPQFETYRGRDEASFLKAVREASSRASQTQE